MLFLLFVECAAAEFKVLLSTGWISHKRHFPLTDCFCNCRERLVYLSSFSHLKFSLNLLPTLRHIAPDVGMTAKTALVLWERGGLGDVRRNLGAPDLVSLSLYLSSVSNSHLGNEQKIHEWVPKCFSLLWWWGCLALDRSTYKLVFCLYLFNIKKNRFFPHQFKRNIKALKTCFDFFCSNYSHI